MEEIRQSRQEAEEAVERYEKLRKANRTLEPSKHPLPNNRSEQMQRILREYRIRKER